MCFCKEEMAYNYVCAVCMSNNFIGNSLLYMRPCFKVIQMLYSLRVLNVVVECEVVNRPSPAVGNCLGKHHADNALNCH